MLRSTTASLIGLLPVLPLIADAADIDTVPIVASVLTVSAAVTRILAIPQVELWLRRWSPLFAADIYPTRTESADNDNTD